MLKKMVFACAVLSCSMFVAAGPKCGKGEGYWDFVYRNVTVCTDETVTETYEALSCTLKGTLRRGFIPSQRTLLTNLPKELPWTVVREFRDRTFCPLLEWVQTTRTYDYLNYRGQRRNNGVVTYRGMMKRDSQRTVTRTETRTEPVCRTERRRVRVFRCGEPR